MTEASPAAEVASLAVPWLLVDVLGKNPQTTFVIIDEIDTDNWGITGEPVTARRARGV